MIPLVIIVVCNFPPRIVIMTKTAATVPRIIKAPGGTTDVTTPESEWSVPQW